MRTVAVTVLVVASLLLAVGMGHYLGSSATKMRVATACINERAVRIDELVVECGLAPGWWESR